MTHYIIIDVMKLLYFSHSYKYVKKFNEIISIFLSTLGDITLYGIEIFRYIFTWQVNFQELMYQCYRFGVVSLPITLSIVGMTSIIVAMQVAGEMVKQGGGNYVGMLVAMLIVREVGVIMSGFAIISMIGSSMASEIATMRVTEQVDALNVLKVSPIRYLFVPRVLAGALMMPLVVIIASLFGVVGGGVASNLVSELSYRAFFSSVWSGLNIHDMNVCLLKALSFGFTIALISCASGYKASGGAKGVGIATTRSVVWSFIAIVILDLIFAVAFFF